MTTNLTSGIPPQPYGAGGRSVFLPVKATQQLWQGGMVAEVAGALVPATTAGSGPVVGVSEADALGGATDGATRAEVLYDRIYVFAAGANAPTDATPFGTQLYAETDNTVGTQPSPYPCGLFAGIEDNGRVRVFVNMGGAALAQAPSAGAAVRCRCVLNNLSEPYTGSGTGILTATTNAAIGTQDTTVNNLAAGDYVLLPAGGVNTTAATDEGPYVVLAPGASGSKYVLARAPGWGTGTTLPDAASVVVGEGSTYAGTTWHSFAGKGAVIDTTDPAMYPERVSVPVTLGSAGAGTGAATVTGIPIRTTGLPGHAGSGFQFTLTGPANGALTVKFSTGAVTSGGAATAAGRIGTAGSLTAASVSVTALVAAGSYNTADTSTGVLTITN